MVQAQAAVTCPDCGEILREEWRPIMRGRELRWICDRCQFDFDPVDPLPYPTEDE